MWFHARCGYKPQALLKRRWHPYTNIKPSTWRYASPDGDATDFKDIDTWGSLLQKVAEFSMSSKASGREPGEISVHSWRKFKRIISKAVNNDDMFANTVTPGLPECRLADELMTIRAIEVKVIDIAKLPES